MYPHDDFGCPVLWFSNASENMVSLKEDKLVKFVSTKTKAGVSSKKYWDLIHLAPDPFRQIYIQLSNTIPEACPK